MFVSSCLEYMSNEMSLSISSSDSFQLQAELKAIVTWNEIAIRPVGRGSNKMVSCCIRRWQRTQSTESSFLYTFFIFPIVCVLAFDMNECLNWKRCHRNSGEGFDVRMARIFNWVLIKTHTYFQFCLLYLSFIVMNDF